MTYNIFRNKKKKKYKNSICPSDIPLGSFFEGRIEFEGKKYKGVFFQTYDNIIFLDNPKIRWKIGCPIKIYADKLNDIYLIIKED